MKKVNETDIKDIKLEIPPAKNRGRKQIYRPEMAKIAGRLVAAGFEEKDLGYVFECSKYTIHHWKRRYPEFKDACSEGKRREKKRLVAQALLSAVGYDYHTCKTKITKDKEGKVVKSEETHFDNHQPSNDRLLVFLLCNIDNQLGDNEWHSKQKLEIEQKNINIQITGLVRIGLLPIFTRSSLA
ncbi:hypothetical protein LCGC14_2248840 [marine sediment metagenome]|uniref:Uncharacterized protein n=1 Tax=marine sediment metagenome TaxID=412755 RepID=A0A0F9D2Y1_9ZZZZ